MILRVAVSKPVGRPIFPKRMHGKRRPIDARAPTPWDEKPRSRFVKRSGTGHAKHVWQSLGNSPRTEADILVAQFGAIILRFLRKT